jgi:hypothetical protein
VLSRVKKPKVLVLSIYPVSIPKDGGQIRAAAESAALRRAGFQTSNLVVATDAWPTRERPRKGYFRSSAALTGRGYPWVCWDLALGREIHHSSTFRASLRQRIALERPDVVLLIQPWLWPICQELMPSVPVVYSSQNIEHRLKQVNLAITEAPSAEESMWVSQVKDLESEVLSKAFRSTAVSESDAQWMRTAAINPVVVAQNGTHRRTSTQSEQNNWRRHLSNRRVATFIASGHPPNAVGFWEMFAPSLSYLQPEEAIVALGSIGTSLVAHPQFCKHRATNNARLIVGGYQPEAALSAVLDVSHAVLLPITFGEGSNLKTAEALLSPRLIVGTTRAFRGFETYEGLPGVVLANDPEEFRGAVQTALRSPQLSFERPEAEDLLWQNTLKPLITAVQEAVR